ncbi:hypothetical protein [Cryobacterium serini]|uniref:Uncharacterized protein n=1 Tax=Cryobacterium serini TaxID=1259201 RepID=A0A4R9BPE1_9MICO|nr:hypothetical protein [Cryobacterium serini]TFD88392.1 hypothetical protein E3T51_09240 [Cryobacterium serini]
MRITGPTTALVSGLLAISLLSSCSTKASTDAPDPAVDTPDTVSSQEPITPTEHISNGNDPAITPENEIATLESLRFTPDLDGQAVGEKYTSNISRWGSAGATSETFYAWVEAGLPDMDIYAAEIAKNNVHVYATGLFGQDYESNPYVMDYISGVEKSNAAAIIGFTQTYSDENRQNSNSLNKEPLQSEIKTLSVSVESESEEKLIIVVQQRVEINDENTMYAGRLPNGNHMSNTYLGLIKDPNIEGNRIISTLDINDIN